MLVKIVCYGSTSLEGLLQNIEPEIKIQLYVDELHRREVDKIEVSDNVEKIYGYSGLDLIHKVYKDVYSDDVHEYVSILPDSIILRDNILTDCWNKMKANDVKYAMLEQGKPSDWDRMCSYDLEFEPLRQKKVAETVITVGPEDFDSPFIYLIDAFKAYIDWYSDRYELSKDECIEELFSSHLLHSYVFNSLFVLRNFGMRNKFPVFIEHGSKPTIVTMKGIPSIVPRLVSLTLHQGVYFNRILSSYLNHLYFMLNHGE